MEEYDFLPFDVNQDKHPYSESENHDLFIDALLRTDMKLDENILSKDEHEKSIRGNERPFLSNLRSAPVYGTRQIFLCFDCYRPESELSTQTARRGK